MYHEWEGLRKFQIKFFRGNAADLSFDAMFVKNMQNSFAIVFLSYMFSPLTVKEFEETVDGENLFYKLPELVWFLLWFIQLFIEESTFRMVDQVSNEVP